jgi:transketolase C-terminal domain/subunit
MAIGYLPYLRRFYAPADARAAFVAVKDLAAGYGAHLIGIPRDNVPILDGPDGQPLWDPHSHWTPTTVYRRTGSRKAILAFGCTAFLGLEACEMLAEEAMSLDVIVVNGLPIPDSTINELIQTYPEGLVTIEDGIIGQPECGLRGFAGLIQTATLDSGVPCRHVGITDPRIAPSDGFRETWDHFGITADSLVQAVRSL